MLETIKKAHSLELLESLDNSLKCPVSISIIKDYLKVLKPAYILNINLQRNTSSIAEVIPAISKIMNNWETIVATTGISESIKNLCKLLIEQFKKRFHYEMKCDIYQV
jgi:hypothetical protein